MTRQNTTPHSPPDPGWRLPRWPARLVAALSLFCVGVVVAQPRPEADEQRATATLPISNEALLITSRVTSAIERAEFRSAIELIEQLGGAAASLVAAPASNTYYPAWRQAMRLYERFPPQAVELYRQLYDAEIEVLFKEAARGGDIPALRALFRQRRPSRHWRAIGSELATRLMERGRFGEAIEVLRDLLRVDGGQSEAAAQLAVALAQAGARGAGSRALDRLARNSNPPDARLDALREWRLAQAPPPPGALGDGPLIQPGSIWWSALDGAVAAPDESDVADAVADWRRYPLQEPAIHGGLLVVRMEGWIWAFDAASLAPRWRQREMLSVRPPVEGAAAAGAADGLRVRDLLWSHLRHVLAVDERLVYTIERLPLDDRDEAAMRRSFQFTDDTPDRNELVARAAETGRVAWRSAASAAGPLFDVAFQDRPLTLDGRLVAAYNRGGELLLGAIDRDSGALRTEVPVVSPPTRFSSLGGRCLLEADETTIYVCTGNGVIAALDRHDLAWKWATVYSSTLAHYLGRFPWQTPEDPPELGVERPVIADDLLIAAPIDSRAILALDRFTGEQRWRLERERCGALVGAVSAGLVVAGPRATCLSLVDPTGRDPVWRSAPLEVSGRGAVLDDRVYLPTREGLVALDGATGRLIADQERPAPDRALPDNGLGRDGRGANLLATPTALYSVTPRRITKYPDLPRERERYEQRSDPSEPRDASASLALAWLDLLGGNARAALDRLTGTDDAGAALSEPVRRLISLAAVSLARKAPEVHERIRWLERAAEAATQPLDAARLRSRIGETLEANESWDEALGHYARLVVEGSAGLAPRAADGRWQTAVWLEAALRARNVLDRCSADSRARFLHDALAASEPAADRIGPLERAFVALEATPLRAELAREIVLRAASPERAAPYLEDAQTLVETPPYDPAFAVALWDVHVALGLREAAELDQTRWQAFIAGAAPSRAVDASLLDRVAAIEAAQKKLAPRDEPPLEPALTRQWKIEGAELLLDPRPSDLGGFFFARRHEERKLQMIHAHSPGYPWRQTADALEELASPAAAFALPDRVGAIGGDGAVLPAWPALMHAYFAVAPVEGGVVCMGRGSERRGGYRLWSHPVPEWPLIPADFERRSAGCERGVFLAPRADRVELIGWDGAARWRRDLPDAAVDRIETASGRLFVITQDRRVLVYEDLSGVEVARLPRDDRPFHGAAVVGRTLLAWGEDFFAGFSTETLAPAWQTDDPPDGAALFVCGERWVAYRPRRDAAWMLLEAASGAPACPQPLGTFDRLSAVAEDGGVLFVAGQMDAEEETGTPQRARLAALDRTSGRPLWNVDLDTRVPINATQLSADPRYIPALLARQSDEGRRTPTAITLVRKSDGVDSQPQSISDDFRAAESRCELYLLGLPHRIVVQASGTLLSYGGAAGR